MPIETPSGVLEVENAKLRASSIEATIAVGIGTESNDAYPLQVFKETEPDIRIQEGSTISSASRIYSNNSNLYIQTGSNFTSGSSGDVAFQTMEGASTHMVIKSDGKVGVGTDSPARAFEIAKTGGSAIINLKRVDAGTGQGALAFVNTYSNVAASISCSRSGAEGGELLFFTVPNDTTQTSDNPYLIPERMRIDSSGNVGIGTASPSAKLHVNGNFYAPGSLVQVVSSTKTDTFSTTGYYTHPLSPGNDVPGLSVTIQPKFASSKILISYDVNMGSYGRAYLRIQRKQGGSTTNIEAPVGPEANTQGKGKSTSSYSGGEDSHLYSASYTHYDTAGSTTPITYQIQAWTYHATYYVYINRARADGIGNNDGTYWARTLSSITAIEVCQ